MTMLEAPIFFLHFLGGSAKSWQRVASALGPGVETVPLDLPGFGDAAGQGGENVASMADRVAGCVRARAAGKWWIAGHSMGAKIALVLARRAEDGEAGLRGLAGVALIAGSPPGPEPMDEDKRADMLSWIDGREALRREKAREYIRQNCKSRLDGEAEDVAVADVLRCNPTAWKAWLTGGSREDWGDRIGLLSTPALVLSGAHDEDLGAPAQERLVLPHLAEGRHETLAESGHLLPLEQPVEVARHLCAAFGFLS